LKAAQISTTVILVTSVAFLYLGQEVRNTGRLFQLYLWHRDLQLQFVTALANQDRPFFLLQAAPKQERGGENGVRLAPPGYPDTFYFVNTTSNSVSTTGMTFNYELSLLMRAATPKT